MDNAFNIITNLIVFVPLVVIFAIMPYIVRKDIVFGVTVPQSEWGNDDFKKMRKTFTLFIVLVGAVLMSVSIIGTVKLSEGQSVILMQITLWASIVLYSLLYIYFWNKTKKYKEQAGWKAKAQNIAVADTSTDYKPRALSSVWFILYVAAIAATYLGALRLYDAAPDMIPMRVDMQGNPLVMAEKSMSIVYQMIGMQVFMAVMFFGINETIKKAKKIIDPNNAQKSSKMNDEMKYHWSVFLFFTGLMMLLIFAQIIIAMFTKIPVWVTIFTPMFLVLVILVYAIVLSIKTGQSGNRLKNEDSPNAASEITRDDDSYWKLGSLYYNKEDPAVFVEKRFGVGWTINWARWQSWLFIVVIIAFIAASFVLGS